MADWAGLFVVAADDDDDVGGGCGATFGCFGGLYLRLSFEEAPPDGSLDLKSDESLLLYKISNVNEAFFLSKLNHILYYLDCPV